MKMGDRLKQILLIEDNLGDAELLQETLGENPMVKIQLTHVVRLREALNQLGDRDFDAILLDLSLPDSRGLNTLMRVQEAAPKLPIVVLTGWNDETLAIEAVRDGAQDYLVKGKVEAEWLVRSLDYAIERKQTLEALRESEERFQQLAAQLDRLVTERTAQLEQALHFEAMLKRIADKVRDSLDENQILQTAVEELASGLGVDGCGAGIYNWNQTKATIAHEWTNGGQSLLAQVVEMAQLPDVYGQLLAGETFQFCPIAIAAIERPVAILASPIFDDRGILGNLWLLKPMEGYFAPPEIRLVEQVANQCAIALRQARLYQSSQAQVRELERLNQLKDDFLSTISHELRTPVANIKMATQMLEVLYEKQAIAAGTAEGQSDSAIAPNSLSRELAPNSADRYFQILHDECEREIHLINNILDMQRLEAGVEPLELSAIQLQHWIPHLVEPFVQRMEKNQQHLRLEIAADLPSLISDPDILGRIVAELLNNACKYTPSGEEIAVALDADEAIVRLQVTNTGIEIPERELAHIFEKFYRVPSSDPWKHGGTGLGLALVQKSSQLLGGQIRVTSQGGQTCFILELQRHWPQTGACEGDRFAASDSP
ncbi:MAG: hybrid sensor histidine kinase/response regulator [Cyanobacteria bacterium J007]|nr:MAG: hybrid sensor histidine kinase/response regulator [Cyanobacteria bacterium J007]